MHCVYNCNLLFHTCTASASSCCYYVPLLLVAFFIRPYPIPSMDIVQYCCLLFILLFVFLHWWLFIVLLIIDDDFFDAVHLCFFCSLTIFFTFFYYLCIALCFIYLCIHLYIFTFDHNIISPLVSFFLFSPRFFLFTFGILHLRY